jgi:uncharacterized protein (TIGR02996 family)
MASIDELWSQVCETPDDLGARLVLGDALIETVDPSDAARGELIALQCRGADAKVLVGETAAHENVAERVSELIAAHWSVWLGDTSPLLMRQGSTFADGMLSLVQVGGDEVPHAAWANFRGHHELCAVKRVRPFKVRADHYAMFLAGLRRDPVAVEIHQPLVLTNLRARREHWAIRELRFGGIAWWSRAGSDPKQLVAEFRALSEMAPQLERLDIQPTYSLGAELAAAIAALPRMFPKLQRVKLEETDRAWLGDAEPGLRAMSFVEFA